MSIPKDEAPELVDLGIDPLGLKRRWQALLHMNVRHLQALKVTLDIWHLDNDSHYMIFRDATEHARAKALEDSSPPLKHPSQD